MTGGVRSASSSAIRLPVSFRINSKSGSSCWLHSGRNRGSCRELAVGRPGHRLHVDGVQRLLGDQVDPSLLAWIRITLSPEIPLRKLKISGCARKTPGELRASSFQAILVEGELHRRLHVFYRRLPAAPALPSPPAPLPHRRLRPCLEEIGERSFVFLVRQQPERVVQCVCIRRMGRVGCR